MTIERVAECQMPTEHGEFRMITYLDAAEDLVHTALVMGDFGPQDDVLVRVHVMSPFCDTIGSRRETSTWPLPRALQRVAEEGRGAVIVLGRHEQPRDLIHRLRQYQLQDRGIELPTPEPSQDLRNYGIGAQIVADLGIRRMRVLGSPRKLHGLSGFGLEVVEYLSTDE
jgi:3,4-dihydroxy 2-butanone 4-phosphate synthase/GTP cyclohydrolase II